MTLSDFLKLVRHHLALFLIIVLAFTLAGGAFGFIKANSTDSENDASDNGDGSADQFMARATILVSTQPGAIGGIADAEADAWNQENNERYGEWLIAEGGRMQQQLELSTNTSSKKSVETSPGSWLKADFASDFKDLTIVEAQTLEDSNTIVIAAIGPDPDRCIEAANSVADKTETVTHELFDASDRGTDGFRLGLNRNNTVVIEDEQIRMDVIKATAVTAAYPLPDYDVILAKAARSSKSQGSESDSPSTMKSVVKYGAVGFAGGILLALIVILLIDIVRKPIRNAEELASRLDVPVLAAPNNQDNGDMLLANMKLAAGGGASRICIGAVGAPSASALVFEKIKKSGNLNGPEFDNVGSLTSSGDAVEAVAKSDGVVLCMREWKDTVPELEDALNELAIANARIIGIAMLG